MKPSQKQIISILSIFVLSDGKIRSTKDLISKLNDNDLLENFYFVTDKYKKNIVINDINVPRAMEVLVEKCIVKKEAGESKGAGIPNLYKLIMDPKSLFSLFKYFNEINFAENIQKHLLYRICQTTYCKQLINGNFVYRLNDLRRIEHHLPPSLSNNEFKNNMLLREMEFQHIIRIINISPSALFKVLSLLYDPEYYIDFYLQDYVTSNHIINEIIFELLVDLKNNIPMKRSIICRTEVYVSDEPIIKDEVVKIELDSWYESDMILSLYKSIDEL